MKLKSKLYKTVVRAVMVYGSECWALRFIIIMAGMSVFFTWLATS